MGFGDHNDFVHLMYFGVMVGISIIPYPQIKIFGTLMELRGICLSCAVGSRQDGTGKISRLLNRHRVTHKAHSR